jgi:DtxR family transcriptional regulator, Mn-dependent transcriptional regulator
MLSSSIQEYLKTIFKLHQGRPVSTTAIAKELNISGASVTGMLKRLSSLNLVVYNSYKGVVLSKSGMETTLKILRRHRLIETFLKEVLHYDLSKIHTESSAIDFSVSDYFIHRIDLLLGHPKYSPFGKPIPSAELIMPVEKVELLSDVEPGRKVIIRRLDDTNNEIVDYLEKKGYIPGTVLDVQKKEPFLGPISLYLNGQPDFIGYEIAKRLFVEEIVV